MNYDFFRIYPQVFSCMDDIVVKVEGIFSAQKVSSLLEKGKLQLRCVPSSGTFNDRKAIFFDTYRKFDVRQSSSNPEVLEIPLGYLTDEGEYYCCLELAVEGKAPKTVCEFEIYLLDDDLKKRLPLKGDMHIHTNRSECGNFLDDPQFVAAKAREKGLDFIALTDHMQTETSESMLDFPQRFDSEFCIFRGEECHVLKEKVATRFGKNNFFPNIHIVNFGGDDCVSRYANDHYEEFCEELEERAKNIDLPYPPETLKIMAGADWIFDKIHEFNGLAVFCHPTWKPCHRDNLSEIIRNYIVQKCKFDAVELVGLGTEAHSVKHRNYTESLNLCQAFYTEMCCQKGKLFPVIGNTDSHNALGVLGRHFTIVFAEDNSISSIKRAISQGYSVAVIMSDDPDDAPQIFGSFRMVKYAHFLIRNYYAKHDELCAIEGKLMLAALRGELDEDSVKFVVDKKISGYNTAFYNI